MKTSIAFVTTCKGRLNHIQKTLPMIVAQAPDEIVVVDYGCPQRAGEWIEANFRQVKVIRVTDDPGFWLARARNIGASHTTSQWICFIDADVQIARGFVDSLRRHLNPLFYYRAAPIKGRRVRDTCGTFVCSKSAFDAVGGYDEVFSGWGGEDDDLYFRLWIGGLRVESYPSAFVNAIDHGDAERSTFYDLKEIKLHQLINELYMAAKHQIIVSKMAANRQIILNKGIHVSPPLERRQALMEQIKQAVLKWSSDTSQPMPSISFDVTTLAWLPEPYRMVQRCTFTFAVDQRPPVGAESPPE